jgi:hypothetical protein
MAHVEDHNHVGIDPIVDRIRVAADGKTPDAVLLSVNPTCARMLGDEPHCPFDPLSDRIRTGQALKPDRP